MNRVLDRLWLGSTHDFASPLRALGFVAALDLREGVHPAPEGLAVHRIDNLDGQPWNRKQVIDALDFVHEKISKGKVLVACVAGMSRSVCMVTGYLVRCGMDEVSAYGIVRDARAIAVPKQKMLDSVLEAVRK